MESSGLYLKVPEDTVDALLKVVDTALIGSVPYHADPLKMANAVIDMKQEHLYTLKRNLKTIKAGGGNGR